MHPEELRTATGDLFDTPPQIVESGAGVTHQVFASGRQPDGTGLRSNSVVLIVLSSLRIAWLTALGVKCNSSAASLNEPVRAAASKARIAEIGMLDSSMPISEPDSTYPRQLRVCP